MIILKNLLIFPFGNERFEKRGLHAMDDFLLRQTGKNNNNKKSSENEKILKIKKEEKKKRKIRALFPIEI